MTKIAILGSHPLSVWQAPFEDPDWKIWACSPHNFEHRILPRVDEWFEVHRPARHQTRADEYLEYVRTLSETIPVWMRDRSGHPHAREYPEEELKAEFGEFNFTSSIAYMLAMAIKRIAEERGQTTAFELSKRVDSGDDAIGLWGIMQASQNEYQYQRPGIQNWLLLAHQRGIEVVVPRASMLLHPPEEVW